MEKRSGAFEGGVVWVAKTNRRLDDVLKIEGTRIGFEMFGIPS